ncbi:B3/B4 domain-containing protein [Chromobacterium alticapitis]|uniref:B3/B4 domain-containing protein n=1 Tax=Chromobacterium alticapitis TaxID=2073169 RepID=UPI0018ECC844|nr:phenylalanine--tRNA ligase beta subunit-related protein [Chromobacterium alticapitis]
MLDLQTAALPMAVPALAADAETEALLQRWKDWYRALPGDKKARCSLEYLVKAARKDKLRSILPLVDLYNQASLLSLAPFGGEDVDKLGGALRLDLARGEETFLPLGRTETERPQSGEAAWLNGEGEVVCRCLNWLESDHFKLTEASRNIVFVSERPDAGFPSGSAGMDWLARELAPHAGSLTRFRLDAAHPVFAM